MLDVLRLLASLVGGGPELVAGAVAVCGCLQNKEELHLIDRSRIESLERDANLNATLEASRHTCAHVMVATFSSFVLPLSCKKRV